MNKPFDRFSFPWGLVKQTHEVGPYMVVEYHPRKTKGCEVTREIDHDQTMYHPYVDGRDTSNSFSSLEEALAFSIAYRKEGGNTRAHTYFIRGLGLNLP